MLNDSYNKLYNAKIKKFIKTTEDSSSNGERTNKPAKPGLSKVRLKHSTDLPRLGVDFGFLKTKPVSEDLRDPDTVGDAGEVTYSSNLNLPPLGIGSNGAYLSQVKVNAKTPQLNAPDLNVSGAAENRNINTTKGIDLPNPDNTSDGMAVPNQETQIGLDSSRNIRAPKVKMDIRGSAPKTSQQHINFDKANNTFAADSPKVQVEGTSKELKMPRMDFSGSSNNVPEYELITPSVPFSKLSLKRLKSPDLNIDDPSSFEGLSKIKLSGRSPDLDLDMSGEREFQSDLNGPNVDISSGKLTLSKPGVSGKRDAHVETPDLSIERPKIKEKIWTSNINVPEADLKRSKVDRDIPVAALKGPLTKYKAPKFTMPKFDLPEIDVNKKLDLKTTNVAVSAPKFKRDIDFSGVDTELDLNKPAGKFDLDADASSGKFKLSKFSPKLFGSPSNKGGVDVNAETPELQMKSPKINMDVPDMKVKIPNLDILGGIDASNVHLPNVEVKNQTPEINIGSPKIKMPKLKTPNSPSLRKPEFDASINGLDVSINSPSVSLKDPNVNVAAPSGKLRKPDLGLSGPRLNGPKMNLSGDINAPEVKTPKADFKALHLDMSNAIISNCPKLDADTPDVSIGSPKGKLKMPKLKMPNFKGSEIDGNINEPEFNAKKPSVDLKVPKPDLDIDVAGPSGKFKKPHMSLPELALSGPNLDGPNLDLKSPGLEISGPNIGGGMNAPDVKIPKFNNKSPKLNFNASKPDVDMVPGHLKMPELHGPDLSFNSPSGKVKLPKSNISLPKGPHLDVEADLKSPKLNLKAPKFQSEINTPDLQMDLKTPELDMNAPDVKIASPKAKFKMPKFKLPTFSLPSLKGPEIDGKLEAPHMNINQPNVSLNGSHADLKTPEISGPSGKFKKPNLNIGDMKLSAPHVDGPKIDLQVPALDMPKAEIRSPKLDLNATKIDVPKGKLNLPELHKPNLDTDAPSGKLKFPKVNVAGKLPQLPNLDINSGLQTPDLNVKAPNINWGIDTPHLNMPDLDVKSPALDVNAPNVKLGSPKAKLQMPKVQMPKFDLPSLKGPEIDGSFDGPNIDMNAPTVDIRSPKADLDIPDVDVGSSGKFKMPNLNLPDLGLSGPRLNGPEMNLSGDINAPEVKTPKADFKAPHLDMSNVIIYNRPKLDADTPDVSIGSPKGKLKMPKLKMPNFKGSEIDGNINEPEFNAKKPSVDLKVPKPDLDIDVAGPSGKFKKPHMSLPELALSGPNLDGPNLDLKSPGLDISGPSLGGGVNAPNINVSKADIASGKLRMPELHSPDWDINPPTNSLKFPKFNLSGSLPKGPDLNGLKTADLGLKSPKIKGGLDAPDLPNMDLKAPKLDVRGPDVNAGSPKTKLKMPKLNMPKINLPTVKGPKAGGSFDGPDVDINAPHAKLKGTRPSFEMPDVDFGADIGSGLKAPNLAMPDANLKSPTLDFNTPKFDADMPSGKVKMPTLTKPKAELHSPELDVHALKLNKNSPDVNIGSPKTKFKMPKLKFRKFSFPGLNGPEIDGPDVDVNVPNVNIRGSKPDLDMPDVDISGQSAKFSKPNLNLPTFDLSAPKFEGPNLDMKSPQVDISGSPKGKLKMPKLKMSKFSLPNLKGPEIDGNLNRPDLNANVPSLNLKGPKSDFDINVGGASGKIKKPNLNLPDLGFSSSVLDGSNLNLKTPDLDVSRPNIGGELKAPNTNIPVVDIKSPKLNLNTPKLDVDMPSGKVKLPTLEKPKAELRAPDMDVDAPSGKLKFPKLDLSGTLPKGPNLDLNADVNSPDLNLKSPKIKGAFRSPDMDLPDLKLKSPKLDVGTPDVNIGSPKTRLKMPKLKMPKMNLPNLKGPEINGNFHGPTVDINAPNVNLKGTKPSFQKPDVDFDANMGSQLKAPNISMPDVSLRTPNLNFNDPKLDVDMPSGKVKMPTLAKPNTGLHGPDLDVDASSGKLKCPNLNLSGTLPKGPNLDLKADVNSPDLSMKSPKIKGAFNSPDIDMPDMKLKSPKLDVGTPNGNIGSPKTGLKMPKLKMPKINFPNIKGPEIDGQDVDVNTNAKLKGSKPLFEIPEVGFGRSLGKPEKPHLSIPDVSFSSPHIDGPDINLRSPALNAKLPKGPNVSMNSDLKTPDIHLSAPNSKIKGEFNSPKMDLPKIDSKAPGLHGANIKKPKIKMPKGPTIDIDGDLQEPDINVPNIDVKNVKGKLQMPSIDVSGPEAKTVGMDLSGHKLKGSAINVPDVKVPVYRVKGLKIDLNAKHPHLEMKDNMGKPDNNFNIPNVKGDIRGPDLDMNGPSGTTQGPQFDLNSAKSKFGLTSFKLPQFGGPDINRTGSDIECGASLQPTNIAPPNANLSTKPSPKKGNIIGPAINTANMDLGIPKVTMQNPQLHQKTPDLDIDGSLLNFNKPSGKNRRSDATGVNMKMPALDASGDVRLQHHKRSKEPDVRSSYLLSDAQFSHHIGFKHSDLNIDDFTGKDYVLQARGSKNADQVSHNHGKLLPVVKAGTTSHSQTRGNPSPYDDIYAKVEKSTKPLPNTQLPHLSQDSGIRATDSTDSFLVTVFPSKVQNPNPANRKYKTLGGTEFYATNVDLEVPNENDLKGSTFLFSNLV